MKIKKMYQGTVPENKILDTYSTSATDTYSCNYVNGLETYSTDEVRIGTWIDGKPIYRRTITTTVPNINNQWAAVVSNITGIDNITKLNGIIVGGDGRKISIPYYESTSYFYSLSFQPNANQIQIYGNGAAAFSGKTLYIIVEYTKTTDV